ncbi:MAG: hypothetical protein NDI94_00295 [Candidatus Woesearchaeota archaeon]|nr:hypothetical protein [Candidatus Woesearchaeota archaeon]
MITNLIMQIEERKGKLITILDSKQAKTKRYQEIIGAIAELDNILKLLRDLKETEEYRENNPDDVFLYKPTNHAGVIQNAKDFVRELF